MKALLISGVLAAALIATPAVASARRPAHAHAAMYLYKLEAKAAARHRIRKDARKHGELYDYSISGCSRYRKVMVGCDYDVEYRDDATNRDWYCDAEMIVKETSHYYVTWSRHSHCSRD